jgi:hypothetical protein
VGSPFNSQTVRKMRGSRLESGIRTAFFGHVSVCGTPAEAVRGDDDTDSATTVEATVDTGVTYKMAADDDGHLLSDCRRAVCRNGIVDDETVSQEFVFSPYLVVAGRGGDSTPHFFVFHFRPPQVHDIAWRPTPNQRGWAGRSVDEENPKTATMVATERMRFATTGG